MRTILLYTISALTVLGGAGPAAAQADPGLDVRIEKDTRPRTEPNELGAYYIVRVVDRATGQSARTAYQVFGMADNHAGEKTTSFDCSRAIDNDPGADPGEYLCNVYVDHGGKWDFVALINRFNEDPRKPPVTVARASAPFELSTDKVYTGGKGPQVTTNGMAVALLQGHVILAAAWMAGVLVLAILAVPKLRVRLSTFGVYRFERRLDLTIKLMWWATALVIGSGIYLLLNETAYKTPFSPAALRRVSVLPYGRPYFVALGVKLALYALMVLALVPLVRGARRQQHLGLGMATRPSPPRFEPVTSRRPAEPAGGVVTARVGTVTVDAEAAPEDGPSLEPPASPLVGTAVAVAAVGVLGISMAVTFLKYFHQLIEAVR